MISTARDGNSLPPGPVHPGFHHVSGTGAGYFIYLFGGEGAGFVLMFPSPEIFLQAPTNYPVGVRVGRGHVVIFGLGPVPLPYLYTARH